MSSDITKFPYFYNKVSFEDKKIFKEEYKFLKNLFKPYFKKVIWNGKYFKMTRFLNPKPVDFIGWIRNFKKNNRFGKQPCFIYFDIRKYYPSINRDKLREKIIKIYYDKKYFDLSRWLKVSVDKKWIPIFTRGFKRFLKSLDLFFSYCNVNWTGILTWTSLG